MAYIFIKRFIGNSEPPYPNYLTLIHTINNAYELLVNFKPRSLLNSDLPPQSRYTFIIIIRRQRGQIDRRRVVEYDGLDAFAAGELIGDHDLARIRAVVEGDLQIVAPDARQRHIARIEPGAEKNAVGRAAEIIHHIATGCRYSEWRYPVAA